MDTFNNKFKAFNNKLKAFPNNLKAFTGTYAAPLVALFVGVTGWAFTRQSFITSSNATSAAQVKSLMDEYQKDEMTNAVLELQTYARKEGEKFAWAWVQGKTNGDQGALSIDKARHKVLFFWTKFHVFEEGGFFMFRSFWSSASRATIDKFPCKTRAEGVIKAVEPLDYANCRVCLGRTKEECSTTGSGKPAIYSYLRSLYSINEESKDVKFAKEAMDFVDKSLAEKEKLANKAT